MIAVGLTGGIATGKSTVARILRERGVPVIDADAVAREVVRPGTPGLARVVDRFGPGVLGPDGALDRQRLGALVRSDPAARRDLEAITHPLIRARLEAWLAGQREAGAPAAVVEAALLVETGSWRDYDALLVVVARPETQVARLVRDRGMSEATARAWLAAQVPAADKARHATAVIHNDGPPEALPAEVDRAWRAVLAAARPAGGAQ